MHVVWITCASVPLSPTSTRTAMLSASRKVGNNELIFGARQTEWKLCCPFAASVSAGIHLVRVASAPALPLNAVVVLQVVSQSLVCFLSPFQMRTVGDSYIYFRGEELNVSLSPVPYIVARRHRAPTRLHPIVAILRH